MPYPSKLSEKQILDEAVRIVDESGIQSLSTRVLASRLHASAPSLYRYFPDKEQLVRAVSSMCLTELAAEVSGYLSLADMGRAYWDYGLRHPNRYALVACRLPEEQDPPIDVKLQATEPLHRLATMLTPDRPLITARMLWSYVHGAVSLRLNWPIRSGLDPEEAFIAGLDALEYALSTGKRESCQRSAEPPIP